MIKFHKLSHPYIYYLIMLLPIVVTGVFFGARTLLLSELMDFGVIVQFRLLRVLAALVVGGALAVCGMILQTLLRNVLAEPFTLGISSGAAAGLALTVVSGGAALSIYALPAGAFVGALVIIGVVGVFGSKGSRFGSDNLLLCGVIAGTVASSLLIYVISIANSTELAAVSWFLLGDLGGISRSLLLPTAVLSVGVYIVSICCANDLNVLAFGDETAFYLGVRGRGMRLGLILLAALLAACTVALAGVIGFVGLIVPHVIRKIHGSNHRITAPVMFLAGGEFLVICDLLARTVHPAREIPIGVITALVGAALFFWQLKQRGGVRL